MSLSRRSFLGTLLGVAPAVVAPAVVATPIVGLIKKWVNSWLLRGPLVRRTERTIEAFPIRQDITVLPADDPRKLRLGWVVYEEVGVVVVNDCALSCISL